MKYSNDDQPVAKNKTYRSYFHPSKLMKAGIRLTSWIVLLTFTTTQVAWGQETYAQKRNVSVAETSIENAKVDQMTSAQDSIPDLIHFLKNDSPLSPVQASESLRFAVPERSDPHSAAVTQSASEPRRDDSSQVKDEDISLSVSSLSLLQEDKPERHVPVASAVAASGDIPSGVSPELGKSSSSSVDSLWNRHNDVQRSGKSLSSSVDSLWNRHNDVQRSRKSLSSSVDSLLNRHNDVQRSRKSLSSSGLTRGSSLDSRFRGNDEDIRSLRTFPFRFKEQPVGNDENFRNSRTEETVPGTQRGQVRDPVPFSLSDALASGELRKDYASAIILNEVTEEDIRAALEADFEIAIVVLEGEIVAFTTGNDTHIGALAPALNILEHADFVSHTHVREHAHNGPSELDILNAVDEGDREYVLTDQGAFAYNAGGELNRGRAIAIKDYLRALEFTRSLSKTVPGTQSGQVREPVPFVPGTIKLLNAFIAAMDAYNAAEQKEKEVFRASTRQETLGDGTVLHFETDTNNIEHLIREVLPTSSDEIFYAHDGRTEKYRYNADGVTVEYSGTVSEGGLVPRIEIKDVNNQVLETLEVPTPTALDETAALKVTLEGGIDAYYIDGELVEFRTQTGIRITDFTLDQDDHITDALIVYQDGAVEVIRRSALIRRIGADGTVFDFTPSNFAVREIQINTDDQGNQSIDTRFFSYAKTSQTTANETKIFSLDTNGNETSFVTYDDLGILGHAYESATKDYVYARSAYTETVTYPEDTGFANVDIAYKTVLDTTNSPELSADTLTEAFYAADGQAVRLRFHNGNTLLFDPNGHIFSTTDANGNPVEYDYLAANGYVNQLQVARKTDSNNDGTYEDVTFLYEQDGFLSRVETESGVIHRIQKDTNGDGQITDEDAIALLLEEVGGNRLLDFELDADGNIVNGIIETKEGIRQTIQNKVLIDYTTPDGRFYHYDAVNKKAKLAEWAFRDGVVVKFGEATVNGVATVQVSEILYPNQNRLHSLTVDANGDKKVTSYIEETPEGVRKHYGMPNGENLTSPRLTHIETVGAQAATIHFDITGHAERVVFADTAKAPLKVVYERDAFGKIGAITFQDEYKHRRFTPDGKIVSFLHEGVNAEIANDKVERLFTRFGEVSASAEAPLFDAQGKLNGTVHFNDGAELTVEAGKLASVRRPNGTLLTFDVVTGKMNQIQIEDRSFSFVSSETSGKLDSLKIRFDHLEGTPELPLIPFLEKPDALYAALAGGGESDHPITFYGDSEIQINHKKVGEGAAAFDGSGDSLSMEHDPAFELGAGDWTLDAWVSLDQQSAEYALVRKGDHLNGGFQINRHAGINRWDLMIGGNVVISVNSAMTTGAWHHIALVREGANYKFYQDGVLLKTVAAGSSNITHTGRMYIGSRDNSSQFLPGKIDELRISKTARWATNFTPPTEPYAMDANTVFLNHFDPPKTVDPILNTDVKEISDLFLARPLHNSVKDHLSVRSIFNLSELQESSGAGLKSFTAHGNVHADAAKKKHGDASAAFDGSGDYLSFQDHEDFDFGTGDFTVETWMMMDDVFPGKYVHSIVAPDTNDTWLWFYYNAEHNKFTATLWPNSYNFSFSAAADTWYHVALSREAGQLRLFVNGVQLGATLSSTQNITSSSNVLVGSNHSQAGSQMMKGWLDDLHISKTARWTENFTPPTAPPARDEHTALLLGMDAAEFSENSEIEVANEEEGNNSVELFFNKRVLDPERAEALEFGSEYMPEWLNLDVTDNNAGAWIEKSIQKGEADSAADLTSTLVDMDGDGLIDRLYSPTNSTDWIWQKNNGYGFERAQNWSGVNTTLQSWTIRESAGPHPVFQSDLRDINGDGRPDRVLTQYNDPKWFVQLNNGTGFDATMEWGGDAHALSFYTPEGKYAIESRYSKYAGDIQDLQSALIDMNGDGRLDRIVKPALAEGAAAPTSWHYQKNNGSGFDTAVLWEGVSPDFGPAATGAYADNPDHIASAMNFQYYSSTAPAGVVATMGDLRDLNGDGLPDRILLKHQDPNNVKSAFDWYVQLNNGTSFDAPVLWDNSVRVVAGFSDGGVNNAAIGTAIQVFDNPNVERLYSVRLMDVTGDGLLDRVTLPAYTSSAQSSWWVEVNQYAVDESGNQTLGFAEAVEWTGIEGVSELETSLGQDNDLYHLNPGGVSCARVSPCRFERNVDLRDINGDHIPDRLLFKNGESRWVVQFGTGSGFLPGREMEIEALASATSEIITSRYDYLHVSVKAAQNIGTALGKVTVSLSGTPDANGVDAAYQSWDITNLTTDWQDFYLPIDPAKADANDVKIEFVPAEGEDPDIPIYLDNMTFMRDRAPAMDDWMNRLLTDATVISEVHSDADQTLSEFLGFVEEGKDEEALSTLGVTWDEILNTQAFVAFDAADEVKEMTTVSGNEIELTDGAVSSIKQDDNTLITFSTPGSSDPNTLTQTVQKQKRDANGNPEFDANGDPVYETTHEENALAYSRVRTVKTGKQVTLDGVAVDEVLTYGYAFVSAESCPGYVVTAELTCPYANGTEIVRVTTNNPESPNTEYYRETVIGGNEVSQLVSRLQPNGLMTSYYYNSVGELVKSAVSYKNRMRTTFHHGVSEDGYSTIRAADGTIEEYDGDSRDIAHTTPEGYRYEHYEVNAPIITVGTSRETTTYALANFVEAAAFDANEFTSPDGREISNIQKDANNLILSFDVTDIDGNTTALTYANNDFIYDYKEGEFQGIRMDYVLVVDTPIVTESECVSDCEKVKRIVLTDFTNEAGDHASYSEAIEGAMGETELSSILLKNGSYVEFTRLNVTEVLDEESGKMRVERFLADAEFHHKDGSTTVFKNGKPFEVRSANGNLVISLLSDKPEAEDAHRFLISKQESAEFHYLQALKLWNEQIHPKWNELSVPETTPVQTEFRIEVDGSETLITRKYGDGAMEIFNDAGQIEQVLAGSGERLIQYEYDAEGNPTRIRFEGARRNVQATALRLKADVALENQKALAHVAEREQVIDETIEGEYRITKQNLLEVRARLESKYEDVANMNIPGKAGREILSGAIQKIQGGIDQVNSALESLARQRGEALEQLASQIAEVRRDIEEQTQASYAEIDTEITRAKEAILRQELSPIIYHWYREILGRDPNSIEYENQLALGDADTGSYDAEQLKTMLETSAELTARTAEVNAIRAAIISELNSYQTLDESAKIAFAQSLGIDVGHLVELSGSEVTALEAYLNNQSLHFGQSAFISLEAMLDNAGKTKTAVDYQNPPAFVAAAETATTYSRLNIGVQLILIDILTGTLSPVDEGDLVISVYALRKLAEGFGVDMTSLAITYTGLKAIFEDACGNDLSPATCSLELIAHVDGNHYIIITGFTLEVRLDADGNPVLDENGNQILDEYVHYVDPGAGPEVSLDMVKILAGEFLNAWLAEGNPENGLGYVISPRAPPEELVENEDYRVLTTNEELQIRGSFFTLIALAAVAIINAVVAAVTAIVTAVVAIVSAIVAGLGAILGGIGTFLTGLVTLNAGLMLTGLGAVLGGIATMAGGILAALTTFALTPVGFSLALGYGLQGVGYALEAFGVSPKIAQTFVAGGKIIGGVAMVASGNVALGIANISGGTSQVLSLHTSMSPTMSSIVGIGAAAASVFAGGGPELLTEAVPFLAADLAGAGMTALGSSMGLSSALTALISVPVRAAVGGAAARLSTPTITIGQNIDGSLITAPNPHGMLDYVHASVFSDATLSGLVSVGASIALDSTTAPNLVKNFLPGILGQLVKSDSGSTGGGGGSGAEEAGVRIDGRSFLQKIDERLHQYAQGVRQAVGNVITIGEQVLAGAANATVEGVKSAVKSFANFFNQETKNSFYSEDAQLTSAEISVNGKDWSWSNGTAQLHYDHDTKTLQNIGNGSQATITGLGRDSEGNMYYEKIDYEYASKEIGGATLKQAYENNRMIQWGVYYGETPAIELIDRSGKGWSDINDVWEQTDVKINAPIEFELPETADVPDFFSNFTFNFSLFKGSVAEARVDYTPAPKALTQQPVDIAKELFVVTNGIGNREGEASDYLRQLQMDLHNVSRNDGDENNDINPVTDVIVAPAFTPSAEFISWLKSTLGGEIFEVLIVKLNNLLDTVAAQQGGLQTVDSQVKSSMEAFFSAFGDEHRVRPLVAVGYSGGFVPVVEAIKYGNAEYNVNAFVALGGATVAIGTEIAKGLVRFLEDFEEIASGRKETTRKSYKIILENLARGFSLFGAKLAGSLAEAASGMIDLLGGMYTLIGQDNIEIVAQSVYSAVQDFLQQFTGFEFGLPTQTQTKMMVNVYGSEDVLAKHTSISGYREEWGEFTVNPSAAVQKPLINIEIEGADHFDYILGIDKSKTGAEYTKNELVSRWVAEMLLFTDNPNELSEFLNLNEYAELDPNRAGVWLIKIPGVYG